MADAGLPHGFEISIRNGSKARGRWTASPSGSTFRSKGERNLDGHSRRRVPYEILSGLHAGKPVPAFSLSGQRVHWCAGRTGTAHPRRKRTPAPGCGPGVGRDSGCGGVGRQLRCAVEAHRGRSPHCRAVGYYHHKRLSWSCPKGPFPGAQRRESVDQVAPAAPIVIRSHLGVRLQPRAGRSLCRVLRLHG